MKKNILKIMLGSIILEVILVCIFILMGGFDEMSWHAMASVGIIFGYSLACLFYSKVYDIEEYKNIAVVGSIMAGITALISIVDIWEIFKFNSLFIKIEATCNIVVWSLALISWILSYISTNDLLNNFKKASTILITILSLVIAFMVWTEKYPEGFMLRLFCVLAVLTNGSFICTLILTRIYKKELKTNEQKDAENN